MSRKWSTERKRAHDNLDDYIDWLIENGKDAGRDLGTDGWTLSIDQDANAAAHAEAERSLEE